MTVRHGGGSSPSAFLEHSLPAIFFEQFVDQRHIGVDYRMAEALLPGDQLYQLVGTFDIRSAVEQRARGRRRARQALRGGGVLLERHQFVWVGAEFDAEVEHEIVD